jgi:hypothetical protein
VFFPLLTLAIRKFMISMLWSALYKRFLEKTMTRTEIYESYHSWCKTISITLMLTPTCLMFLNTDLRYACLAACSNMAIEVRVEPAKNPSHLALLTRAPHAAARQVLGPVQHPAPPRGAPWSADQVPAIESGAAEEQAQGGNDHGKQQQRQRR